MSIYDLFGIMVKEGINAAKYYSEEVKSIVIQRNGTHGEGLQTTLLFLFLN